MLRAMDEAQSRPLSARARLVLAAIVLAIVAAFGFLMWRAALGYLFNPDTGFDPRGEAYWKLLYIGRMAGTESHHTFGQHEPHPTRGWTPKPNLQGESTNERGHRATSPFLFQEDAFRILTVGDSFTFGATLEDGEEWPARLQTRSDRYQVINLGVSGYSVAQMYVTLREEIGEFQPHLVILAAITDDLYRSLLSFREYAAPRFVDEDGVLRSVNLPLPGRRTVEQQLLDQYGVWFARWELAPEEAALQERLASGAFYEEWHALNETLMAETAAVAAAHGAECLLVHLASDFEIDAANRDDPGHEKPIPVMEAAAARSGATVVPTRARFLDAGRNWVLGHYGPDESDFAAGIIHEAVQQGEAWREFVESEAGAG